MNNNDIKLRVLSLGAGVQSTTLALMAANGEIGSMPDCAIFADTQAEPQRVYDHLKWLMSPNVLPFPVHIVTAGNIIDGLRDMAAGKRWASIPAFLTGKDGRAALIPRQCTREYKLEPIQRKVRELVGFAPRQSYRNALGLKRNDPVPVLVEQWIGISRDEASRCKDSDEPWRVNRWPLIEKGMTRTDCLKWLAQHEYPKPPKSACVFCPFTDNERWREKRDHFPDEWKAAVEIDRLIAPGAPTTATRKGTRPLFLHRSLRRLDEVDFTDLIADAGGFENECEGMCGV